MVALLSTLRRVFKLAAIIRVLISGAFHPLFHLFKYITARESLVPVTSLPLKDPLLETQGQKGGELFALANKMATVTGTGSGIGRVTAIALARASATVIVADINEAGSVAAC